MVLNTTAHPSKVNLKKRHSLTKNTSSSLQFNKERREWGQGRKGKEKNLKKRKKGSNKNQRKQRKEFRKEVGFSSSKKGKERNEGRTEEKEVKDSKRFYHIHILSSEFIAIPHGHVEFL